jgi:dTDP-4-dehydrorhamnose 3,5-epimerase-like enzyme
VEFSNVTAVRPVELPRHAQDNGELVVIEQGKAIPFPSVRMFTVRAASGAVRGRHAHKRCAQFLVCVHGTIEVECDDGTSKATYLLDAGNKGLLVPASIWASETYLTAGAVLTVLCDRHYEADDYIRNYEEFLAWRKTAGMLES